MKASVEMCWNLQKFALNSFPANVFDIYGHIKAVCGNK